MIKILLVEDSPEIRENTAEILTLAGYEVYAASNGREGYETALQQNPNLIICDIMMPVLDGYGLLHLLSKNEQLKNTPFIFLTAKTERSDFRKGMEMGADDYITKPFTDVELMNAIDSRLRKESKIAERVQALQKLNGFFESIRGEETLKELATSNVVHTYKKKQLVFEESKSPYHLFYIVSGKVRIFKMNDYGKELTVGLYTAGDFFGYQALLENTVYHESAETLEESEISCIGRTDFENLVYKNKAVAQKFIRLLAHDVHENEDQLINLAYNSLRKRVAEAILTLLSKFKEEGKENFSMSISREDLAHIVGTTTESLIRTLSDFKDENIISAVPGNIKVLDESKLRNIIN
ncbi:MAG: response regulator [Bacteroidetes bacterium]|nr:response regulator [Bacteroidota bacterium]